MRRLLQVAAAVWLLSFPVTAAQFVYDLELVGNAHVLAREYPLEHGSVLLFHSYPTGTFTSVPKEQVVRIRLRALDRAARPLQPGETLAIGPTGAGAAPPDATVSASRIAAPGTPAYPYPPYGAGPYGYGYGYGGGPPRSAFVPVPTQTNVGANGFPAGDLPRAVSAEPPVMDQNGFPAAPGAPASATGPNGFPINPNVPGAAPPIGPNGYPVPATPGAPGTAQPQIGPNGFPVPGQTAAPSPPRP